MAKEPVYVGPAKCDFCEDPDPIYDGKTKMGPWAYMCEKCHAKHGTGIKTRITTKLTGENENDTKKK